MTRLKELKMTIEAGTSQRDTMLEGPTGSPLLDATIGGQGRGKTRCALPAAPGCGPSPE